MHEQVVQLPVVCSVGYRANKVIAAVYESVQVVVRRWPEMRPKMDPGANFVVSLTSRALVEGDAFIVMAGFPI